MSEPTRPGSLRARLEGEQQGALVVEDERDIAHFLGAYFRASGARLDHVDPDSVEHVIETIDQVKPACILLDLNLRTTTGFQVLEAIKAHPDHANIPVLIVTANDSSEVRRRAAALGALDLVAKPFLVKQLFNRVNRLIAGEDDPS